MLFKKMLRTIKLYKAQVISMIIMILLGIGVFVGFNIEWYSIDKNTTKFYDETNFADYRIITKEFISDDDYNKIKDIEGIDEITKYLSIDVTVKNTSKVIALTVTSNPKVSNFKLIGEGKEYDENATEGIWISDKFASQNNLKIGDYIELNYKLFTIKEKIVGLIKASEYLICIPDTGQLMPDYNSYGYAYITPATLKRIIGMEIYSQINIKSNLSKSEFTSVVEGKLGKSVIILSKDDTISYSEAQGEAEEGKTMASVLPLLFLIIAVLTMITTMHRIAINEKMQIGILKALGFKDKKVLWHYTSLSLMIGIIGTIFGILFGYGIGYYIMNPKGSMGTYLDMPYWHLYIPPFCLVVTVIILGVLVLIGYLSIKGMLKGTASDALQPYTPKKVKPLLMEKTKVWSKFSFGAKWNLRDVMRHKVRSLMTLFGVFGCTILIIASLGMKDTMNGFVDAFYKESINYNVRITTSDNCSNSETLELVNKYQADYASIISAKVNDKTISLEMYNPASTKVKFLDENAKVFNLNNDGVYICNRLAKTYGYKVGDTIEVSLFDSSKPYSMTVSGIIRSLNESIVFTTEYASKINYEYKINTIFTDYEDIESNNLIKNTQTKKSIIDSFNTFMEIMDLMVIVLIILALVLGVVVLYNLGVMSYMERYREMATLKVVGFKDKKIGELLISQNLWITVFGLLIGLPIGYVTLKYLVEKLAREYEMITVISLLSYVITVVLIVLLSLVVSAFIAKKNKKINMVESLKGID